MNKDPFDLNNMLEQWVEQGDWLMISNMFRHLDPYFIVTHAWCFAWGMITEQINLTEDEMERYCGYWCKDAWMNACKYQKMSEEFMRRHYNDLDWDNVSHYQHLSQDFMMCYATQINWAIASCYQILTPETLEELKDYVVWDYLPLENYNERFVMEHADLIGWDILPLKKQFSEWILREYADDIDWAELSKYQGMSEDFVMEFEDKINFAYLLVNRNSYLRKSFIEKYIDKITTLTWKSQKDEIVRKYGQEFWDKYKTYFRLP